MHSVRFARRAGAASRRWRTGLLTLVVASLAGVSAVASAAPTPPPHPSSTSSGIPTTPVVGKATYGLGAANSKGLDGRPYLNYLTSPGGHTSDHVVVHNYGLKPISLLVYAADATAGSNGSIGFAPRADPGTDASRWIAFAGGVRQISVRLEPKSGRVLPISIAVPANATPGDHLAGVMASYFGTVLGKSGQQIKFEQRVALRALFRVSGNVRSALAVENLHVHYDGTLNPFGAGSATVTYVVRNAGNVLLSGSQKVSISGLFASTGSTGQLARLPLMLPGARFPMRVEVHHVWPQLIMHGTVRVTPLGVAGSVDPGLHVTTASTTFWAIPWTLLALIVVFVALVVLAVVWRRRLNARPAAHSAKSRNAGPAFGEA